MIHTRRGCGERVIESGEETLKATDGGSGRGRKNSIGTIRDMGTGLRQQGEANGRGTQQRNQARCEGNRDKPRRLMGGGCVQT